ncbi:MAG: DUF1864 family protein [Parvularculaceae bacterium]
MSKAAEKFDHWIRTSFVEMNTALEELYFAQEDRANVDGVGDDIKDALAREGRALVSPLAAEGNTDEGFDRAFDLLGNLGLFMGALRRHELTNPAREETSPFAGMLRARHAYRRFARRRAALCDRASCNA